MNLVWWIFREKRGRGGQTVLVCCLSERMGGAGVVVMLQDIHLKHVSPVVNIFAGILPGFDLP